MFLQNAENLDFGDHYNGFEGFYPPKTRTFGTIVCLFIHVFSGLLLEQLVLEFMLTFNQKVRFWTSWAAQLGSKIDPWGDHFGPKGEKDEVPRMLLTHL